MKTHALPIPTLLASALLAACGSGGGGNMVAPSPRPTIFTAPPPPAAVHPCTGTITGDCIVDLPRNTPVVMENGRDSDFALIKRGTSTLELVSGRFRFDGGTRLESGNVVMNPGTTLQSDVTTLSGSLFVAQGEIEGDVDNGGTLSLWSTVRGDVVNHGRIELGATIYDEPVNPRIEGDYVQTAEGILDATFYAVTGGMLTVTGRATLAGTLRVFPYEDWWGPYPLPTTPFSHHVVHADGGVSGTFDTWQSPLIFIEATLRYQPNDVWFDATRIATTAAMQSAGVSDATTLASAGRFDAALARSDAFARDALAPAQDRFLRSAAALQRIDDVGQALRTFDSLSGHGHVAAVDAATDHAMRAGPDIGTHVLGAARRGTGAWHANARTLATRGGAITNGPVYGYDAWIGDGLLVGSSFGESDGQLQVDRDGGTARASAPQWNVYLHRVAPGGAYATGVVGFAAQRLTLDRTIDLGQAGGNAHTERDVDTTFAYVEAGRVFPTPLGRLTPYASVRHAVSHGEAFAESGGTGFELVGSASRYTRTIGEFGARFGDDVRWGDDGWLQWQVAARYRPLDAASDDMQASFAGVPGYWFDLHDAPHAFDAFGWEAALVGGIGQRWSWLMRYEQGDERAVSLGVGFAF